MTSNDVITVELFNSKMETIITQIQFGNERLRNELNTKIDGVENRLNTKIDKVYTELNTKIEITNARLTGVENRLDDLKTFMSIGFSIVVIIVALIAFAPSIADFFKWVRKPTLTEERVQELIDNAVSRALRQSGK